MTFRVWLLLLNVSKVHPCCSINQFFIPFFSQLTVYCWVWHCVYPFICLWALGLFSAFGVLCIVSAAMDICVQGFVKNTDFEFFWLNTYRWNTGYVVSQ